MCGETMRRVPWLLVGTLLGVVAMFCLLPAVSDSTGGIHVIVVYVCLFGGLAGGFALDAAYHNDPPSDNGDR